MEFVHKPVIERRKVLETIRTGFLEALKKEHLRAGVELFQQMTQLSHRIAAGRDAENIVNQAFHELLGNILTREIAFRQFARSQEFVKRDGLRGKWNRRLLTGGHAEGTPRLKMDECTRRQLYWTPYGSSSV